VTLLGNRDAPSELSTGEIAALIGLLIDVRRHFGRGAVVEVDLGERVHRNRPLLELRPHADEVLAAVLDRIDVSTHHRGGQP
jgi:hypothetical protein